jgi:hypothetical protein
LDAVLATLASMALNVDVNSFVNAVSSGASA